MGTDNALQYKQDPNKNIRELGSWTNDKRLIVIYSSNKYHYEDTKFKRQGNREGVFIFLFW